MDLRDRMNRIRANWALIPPEAVEAQIMLDAEAYLEILQESDCGFTLSPEQCVDLARSDLAPTDEHLLRMALRDELLERCQARFDRGSGALPLALFAGCGIGV